MKKTLILLVLLSGTLAIAAQNCIPQARMALNSNNILARIRNNGTLFQDSSRGRFIPFPSFEHTGASTIYSASIWFGGTDSLGSRKLSAQTYTNDGSASTVAGPLSPEGNVGSVTDCINWNLIFSVKGEQIATFLTALPSLANNPGLAQVQFPEIMGWPGISNPFFVDIHGFDLPTEGQDLAPFVDTNLDGIYNPLEGDYPAVVLRDHGPFVPAEIAWCVFNDQINNNVTFKTETQLTAWTFACTAQSALNNTVFTSHKLIFRGDLKLDSCYLAMWVDFDLGCPADDYVGTAADLNSFYVYNQDAIDGAFGNACESNVFTFNEIPPVQSATFLNKSLDKTIAYNNSSSNPPPLQGTDDPNSIAEYYSYMTGHWRDGTPLTYGGNGHQSSTNETNYAFPSDPADPNGWSMCTANLPTADRRMLGIHQLDHILPGQVEELTIAWTAHPNPDLPCGLGTTFADIAAIRNLYNNDFNNACTSVKTTAPLLEARVLLSPNPATNDVTIQYGDLSVLEIRCFDATGRLVRVVQHLPADQYLLPISGLKTGSYTLQILTKAGSLARRFVVLR